MRYQKFIEDMSDIGCQLNPYDPCTANKISNTKHHTLLQYTDDVKGSHVDRKVNDKFTELAEIIQGSDKIRLCESSQG